MKTKLLMILGLIACAGVYFGVPPQEAAAQPGPSAGTPPIGRLVEITLVAWPVSSTTAQKVTGNLLSMTGEWIVVKDGTFEHWMPKEKVMDMKASR